MIKLNVDAKAEFKKKFSANSIIKSNGKRYLLLELNAVSFCVLDLENIRDFDFSPKCIYNYSSVMGMDLINFGVKEDSSKILFYINGTNVYVQSFIERMQNERKNNRKN